MCFHVCAPGVGHAGLEILVGSLVKSGNAFHIVHYLILITSVNFQPYIYIQTPGIYFDSEEIPQNLCVNFEFATVIFLT